MKQIFIAVYVFISVIITACTNSQKDKEQELSNQHDTELVVQVSKYSSGGFSSIVINRSADVVFKMLTDINTWPKINLGVTKSILPENITPQKGVKFQETIASPIPGVEDWTNEWLIEKINPNNSFIISGRDNFTKTPIYSRITYHFTRLTENTTLFKRTIEVTLDEGFVKEAQVQELEALYRFLGSQWEMTTHLKKYVEDNSSN